jgi:hypothetical protein
MADQQMVEGLTTLLQKILGSGLVLNGGLKIDKLTVTTVDKAKELGLDSQESQSDQQQSSQEEASSQEQEDAKDTNDNQEEQQESKGQVTREEFDSLMEEIKYMRSLLQNADQETSGQKGKSQAKQ